MAEDAAGRLRDAELWEQLWQRVPRWRGVPCQQFPSDLWRYAELIWEMLPPFVIEVGSADGGTALFLADLCLAAGTGQVVSVELGGHWMAHPRLICVHADGASPAGVDAALKLGKRGLVLLDGDHSSAQVRRELDLYAPFADYLVVEDTIMENIPKFDDGPHFALREWLPGHPEFRVDPDPVPTQHPGGWLRRIRS